MWLFHYFDNQVAIRLRGNFVSRLLELESCIFSVASVYFQVASDLLQAGGPLVWIEHPALVRQFLDAPHEQFLQRALHRHLQVFSLYMFICVKSSIRISKHSKLLGLFFPDLEEWISGPKKGFEYLVSIPTIMVTASEDALIINDPLLKKMFAVLVVEGPPGGVRQDVIGLRYFVEFV